MLAFVNQLDAQHKDDLHRLLYGVQSLEIFGSQARDRIQALEGALNQVYGL